MKSTARQLAYLRRRGWDYDRRDRRWWRPWCRWDAPATSRTNPISVSSAVQAILVDNAAKARWDDARTRDWPPELYG